MYIQFYDPNNCIDHFPTKRARLRMSIFNYILIILQSMNNSSAITTKIICVINKSRLVGFVIIRIILALIALLFVLLLLFIIYT